VAPCLADPGLLLGPHVWVCQCPASPCRPRRAGNTPAGRRPWDKAASSLGVRDRGLRTPEALKPHTMGGQVGGEGYHAGGLGAGWRMPAVVSAC
jgi:hypothetical protein